MNLAAQAITTQAAALSAADADIRLKMADA
jgi:hypothetical protein